MDVLPVVSEYFHLSPADFWQLRWDELDAYKRRLDVINREADAASRRASRG